jgi:hypothetical protein
MNVPPSPKSLLYALVKPLVSLSLGLAVLVTVNSPARAVTFFDPIGDFLPTYIGPQNPDLDVRSIELFQNATTVSLNATIGGLLGVTPGAVYVWGVNRGAGTEGLLAGSPPVGAGVLFDAVILLRADGTGQVTTFNAGGLPPTTTLLAPGSITTAGGAITAVIPLSLLPSRGFAPTSYLYNLWPRNGVGSNTQISDFAPNASSVFAAVPEPGAWAMMILGFGMIGVALRRRRQLA